MHPNGMKIQARETEIPPLCHHLTIDQLSKVTAGARSSPKAGIDRFLWCKRLLHQIFQAIATRHR